MQIAELGVFLDYFERVYGMLVELYAIFTASVSDFSNSISVSEAVRIYVLYKNEYSTNGKYSQRR